MLKPHVVSSSTVICDIKHTLQMNQILIHRTVPPKPSNNQQSKRLPNDIGPGPVGWRFGQIMAIDCIIYWTVGSSGCPPYHGGQN